MLKQDVIIDVVAVLVLLCCFIPVTSHKENEEIYELSTVNSSSIEADTLEYSKPETSITQVHHLKKFEVTAYCPCEKCCGKWATNRPKDEQGNPIVYGASGARLISGVSVAVDPEVIPYGSIIILGGKEYVAHDCGGKVKGNRIDIYFDNHEDAVKFGKQILKGYVKES